MSRTERVFLGFGSLIMWLNFLLVLVGSLLLVTGSLFVGVLVIVANLNVGFLVRREIKDRKSTYQVSDAVRI